MGCVFPPQCVSDVATAGCDQGLGRLECGRIINCGGHVYLSCLQEQVPFAGGAGFMDPFVTAAVTILCPQGEKEPTLLVELLVQSLCQV